MLTLFFLRGLPGSGKSTLAETIGVPFYEADQWFMNDWRSADLKEAHDWCFNQASESLTHGMSCTVSNTSTTEKEVDRYARLAERMNARFVSLIVENRHGGENEEVPAQTVNNMRRRFSVRL